MLAFHNNPAIKEKYLARVRAHRVADEIVKGRYWENGKGCAVGCTLHSGKHMSYESELGIPVALAHLEDTIFENLPNELALEWPARFLEAAHPGADLSNVVNQFMSWMLIDPTHGVIRFVNTDMDRSAIIGVAAILRTDATAEEIEKALSADSAADSAAALSAACSVADSVDSAADSARSAADSAARKTYWQLERDELLRLVALRGNPSYSQTVFKDNGDPILLNADGTRSVFCDVDE